MINYRWWEYKMIWWWISWIEYVSDLGINVLQTNTSIYKVQILFFVTVLHLIMFWLFFFNTIFDSSMKNDTKFPRFTKGDDIWVPTQEISRNTYEEYWPAQVFPVFYHSLSKYPTSAISVSSNSTHKNSPNSSKATSNN